MNSSDPDARIARPTSLSLAAERDMQQKRRHLIVAATGTGKTMIAAFDYQRWSQPSASFPKLLFIAHREEILRQALGTFRAVLRDHNFGELLVGGAEPEQSNHLFCSIQSYNSREPWYCPRRVTMETLPDFLVSGINPA